MMLKFGKKEVILSSARDLLSTVTLGLVPSTATRQAKKAEDAMNKRIAEQEEQKKKKKKEQKQTTMGFYEGLRSSNTSLLAPKQNQTIG